MERVYRFWPHDPISGGSLPSSRSATPSVLNSYLLPLSTVFLLISILSFEEFRHVCECHFHYFVKWWPETLFKNPESSTYFCESSSNTCTDSLQIFTPHGNHSTPLFFCHCDHPWSSVIKDVPQNVQCIRVTVKGVTVRTLRGSFFICLGHPNWNVWVWHLLLSIESPHGR